jgi:glyoxylase-like metal-dependent hydrolase (beta-lactamase superfamily II)/rhodanese-related sulfurtransferase
MNTSAWRPEVLYEHLLHGPRFQILDVRSAEEFAAWRIEGREPIPTVNVPYFEFLDLDTDEDVVKAVLKSAPQTLLPRLDTGLPVLVVCPHGNTSDLVAEGLRQLGRDAANLDGGMAAWGDHYHVETVAEEAALRILQISRPARGCLSHVLVSEGAAAVIDPLRHVSVYLDTVQRHGARVTHVLDTHMHADHLSGGVSLAEHTDTDYHLHPYDAIHPMDLLPARYGFEFLRDGQRFRIGRADVRAIHIPGHTLGEVAFLVNERWLLAGDSIFIESVARPDLGGHPEQWTPLFRQSLQRLLALPGETVLLPAHFSTARESDAEGRFMAALGGLRTRNEGLALATGEEAAFTRFILASLPTFPPGYVEIKRVNAGLTSADERKASELELGKNVCALASRTAD